MIYTVLLVLESHGTGIYILHGHVNLMFESKPTYEPQHDKTNKVTVRPAKTQISLGIHRVWSESWLSAWRNPGSLATKWADAQADLSLSLAYNHFVGFVMSRLIYTLVFCDNA